ncbi:MAG: ACP S-malonyltransferase [Calditrichia bacterium]
MKSAFVFPGQGSQAVGMGKDLVESNPGIMEIYDQAEQFLGFPLKRLSFEGPESELKETRYTQPALFVHSFAINSLLQEKGIRPDAAAGHSLGEYSALTAAGAFSFQEGLKLVKLRGELMQASGEKNPGTMAAIIGLDDKTVEEICRQASAAGHVNPANFNSPGQIVISGSKAGVHQAMELAKEQKARLVTELVVGGAFHSPLMKEALGGLAEALDQAEIRQPHIPVYMNVTARPTSDPAEIRELLKKQLLSPVLWQNIVENMRQDKVDRIYEVGASRILCGLVKRIERSVQCMPVGTREDLSALSEEN